MRVVRNPRRSQDATILAALEDVRVLAVEGRQKISSGKARNGITQLRKIEEAASDALHHYEEEGVDV